MVRIYSVLQRLRYDLRGQDLIEYALMAGFLAVAVGATFPTQLAPYISQIFSKVEVVTAQAANVGN